MQVNPITYNFPVQNPRNNSQPGYNFVNFGCRIPNPEDFNRAIINRNNILQGENKNAYKIIKENFFLFRKVFSKEQSPLKTEIGYKNHEWTPQEIESVEGLQHGLKIFEGMNIKQVYFILDSIKHLGLNMPIVRGCFHNCAHCFVDAKAPTERMSYEDYHNFVSELSTMYKRFGMDPKHDNWHITGLFHDSDGSELYLIDKNNNIHEFPELVHEITEKLRTPSFIDTAGWNLKSEETQKRMERLVSYYVTHPDRLDKEIRAIHLSLNPFHSFRMTALKQLQKGNVESYNKLYNMYLDMVTNTLNTFAPLMKTDQLKFLCRAYSDDMKSPDLDGFRKGDMDKIKQDILKHFQEKYPQTIKRYPHIIETLNDKIRIHARMGKSGRNNNFSKFAINDRYQEPPAETIPNEQLLKDVLENKYNRIFVDLNGDFYIINDFVSYKTNLRFNFNKKETNKRMIPKPHFQPVEI